MMDRRVFLRAVLSSLAVSLPLSQLRALERQMEELIPDFCQIRQIVAQNEMRTALIASFERMGRALSDIGGLTVFEDVADPNAIWVMGFWKNRAEYDAALQMAALGALLSEQRLLIAKIASSADIKIPARLSHD